MDKATLREFTAKFTTRFGSPRRPARFNFTWNGLHVIVPDASRTATTSIAPDPELLLVNHPNMAAGGRGNSEMWVSA
jgi:hypothetical protein